MKHIISKPTSPTLCSIVWKNALPKHYISGSDLENNEKILEANLRKKLLNDTEIVKSICGECFKRFE